MLVVCCGMVRSGSTLVYQLAAALVERAARGYGVGWVDRAHCRELGAGSADDELRVLKVHEFDQIDGIREAVSEGQATCLYIYRDLRDVVVSIMNKWNYSFESIVFVDSSATGVAPGDIAPPSLLQKLIRRHDLWTSLPDIHISCYENVTQDISKEALRIATHLGIDISGPVLEAISTEFVLGRQNDRIRDLRSKGLDTDSDRILHSDHIHSGASGQWRTSLAPIQVAAIELQASGWLQSHGYTLHSSLRLLMAARMLPWWYRERHQPGWNGRTARILGHLWNGTLSAFLSHKLRQHRTRAS